MTTIWIYEDVNRRCYIAKCEPVFQHVPIMNMKTGEIDIHMVQGIEIAIPKWEWIQKKGDLVWAKYDGCVYDITNLSVEDGKSENSTLKQEGPA